MAPALPQREALAGMSDRVIEDLQVRISHQEVAIDELSRTVARQERTIAELAEAIASLREALRELRPSPLGHDPSVEPPPPHY
jgi:SlyX protein